MRRRHFVQGTAVVAAASGGANIAGSAGAAPPSTDAERLELVKRAMLSMQRASWEQGVAAQAFLELGDDEQVFLMAKEAALRQTSTPTAGTTAGRSSSTRRPGGWGTGGRWRAWPG